MLMWDMFFLCFKQWLTGELGLLWTLELSWKSKPPSFRKDYISVLPKESYLCWFQHNKELNEVRQRGNDCLDICFFFKDNKMRDILKKTFLNNIWTGMNFHLFHSFGLLRMIQPTPFFFSNIICSSRVIVFWKHGYFYYVLIYSTSYIMYDRGCKDLFQF